MEKINTYLDQLTTLAVEFAPKLLLATLILIVGWWVANRVTKLALKASQKLTKNNSELKTFIRSLVNIGLKILLILSVAGIVGIETTSFVGIIAAMGFAVGLALQGNLSNFAAGVLMLIFKPFKVGDEIKIQGFWAFVKEVQIFHTVLEQFDQTEVIIPNSIVMSGTIHNLSSTPTRSITVALKVPFGEDMDRVMSILKEAVYSIPEVDKDAKPFIWITDFESHYMQVSGGFSTSQEGYWDTDYEVRKAVIKAFVKHNIKVTYPTGAAFGQFGEFNTLEKQN